jgi:undecaprenyl-diphosphatase
VIGQKVLGISIAGNVFEIVVHLGTLVSVLIVFWEDIWQLITSLKSTLTQKYIFAIVIGTLPAIIIGFLFKDVISEAFMAIIPGISRSGMTISLGMYLGIAPDKAAKFSFLLGIPAIIGAGLLTGWDLTGSSEPTLALSVLIVGFVSSLLVGWISLKWLLGLIKSGKFHWFGVYCLLIGLISWLA